MKLASPELTQPLIVLDALETIRAATMRKQLVGRLLWRIDQETAPVVDPAGDERLDESRPSRRRESVGCGAAVEAKEAFGADCGDVLVKGQILRQ